MNFFFSAARRMARGPGIMLFNYSFIFYFMTLSVDCRSHWPRGLKVWVCVHSMAGIVGSYPAASMYVSVVSVVRYRSLRRADHSFRGVLPTVVCLSVIVNP